MRTTLTTVLLALAIPFPATLAAQTGDTRAGYLELFEPTGRIPAHLSGVLPPVPGQSMAMLLSAPGHAFGGVFLTLRADLLGTQISVGLDELAIYTDPTTFVTVLPVALPSGVATLQLPIPPSPTLVGLDLAWQAVTMPAAFDGISATNLLLANVGSSNDGNMVFANVLPRSASLRCGECFDLDQFRTDKGKKQIVKLKGDRGRSDQDLEVRVYDPATQQTTTTPIPSGSTSWDLGNGGVAVPAGGSIRICNPCKPKNSIVSVTVRTVDVTVVQ